MKILFTILAFLNGGYMLLDGIFVMINGKYIGPEKPGPWSLIFEKFHVNIYKLGPLFIIFGLLWLTWIYSLWTRQEWAYLYGFIISVLTLWYLPFGTLISIILLVVLAVSKNRFFI